MANENRLDAIDRNALLAEYDRVHIGEPGKARKLIAEAPTMDVVEVVHGEWFDGYAVDRDGKKVYDSIDCSVCEEIFKIESHDREYWKDSFRVCPFCGAIMDGARND